MRLLRVISGVDSQQTLEPSSAVIAAIDGEQVNTMAKLIYVIRTHSAGDTVTPTLTSDGAKTTVGVLLGNA